jgi:WD40 repeat protein
MALPCRLGDYELLQVIGRGGMGVVYKARQVSLDRCVAVKVLSAAALGGPESVHRFRTEAVTAASLQHPNIVAVHEVGHAEGLHYLVMDYVPGPTLAEVSPGAPLSGRRAAQYLRTVAEAVHFAHERGILHRDLKPSNVLLDAEDQPQVTDFGLAKRLESASEFTLSGQVLGSPAFIPPEQASGQRGRVGRRSDVYALGGILYQLLTGRAPFVGEGLAEMLERVLHAEPLRPRLLNPAVPLDLETICLKCLEKEPDRRYSSAQALAEELGRWLEGRPIRARPVGVWGRTWRWGRRKPLVAGLAVGLVLSLVGGLVGTLFLLRRAQSAEFAARQSEYAADMGLVQRELDLGELGRARERLERHRPARGSGTLDRQPATRTDLRGWEWRYLWARSRSDPGEILCEYPAGVSVLAFSEDGQHLAVGRRDGAGTLWDFRARKVLCEWTNGGGGRALALSPSGRLLAREERITGAGAVVVLREALSQRVLAEFTNALQVLSLAFSPAGEELAVHAFNGSVRVWDIASGRLTRELSRTPDDPSLGRYSVTTNALEFEPMGSSASKDYGGVLYSPDGHWLAIGESRRRIRLVDRRTTRETVLPFEAPGDGVTALAISPDSQWLAAGCGWADHRLHLWELSSGRELALRGHHGWIRGLAFSRDGRTLASVSTDRTLRLWDFRRGDEQRRLQGNLDRLESVAWSPDGQQVVTGGQDGVVRVWNLATLRPPPFHVLPPVCYWGRAFPPGDPSLLAALRSDGSVRRWELRWDAAELKEVERLHYVGTNHTCLDLSPDGHWLALGDWTGNVRVWDYRERRQVTNLAMPGTRVGVLFFSPGGRFLNVGTMSSETNLISKFWEVPTWREVHQFEASIYDFTGFGYSPDDRTVGLGFSDGTAVWHDLPSGRGQIFRSRSARPVRLAFSPDGRWFAMAGTQVPVDLLDVRTRRVRPIPGTAQALVYALAFSPDGRRLVGSGANLSGVVRLWDVDSGSEVATLVGAPERGYNFIGFSPDGNSVYASAPWGQSVFWCAPSWEEIERVEKLEAAGAAGK